MKEGNVSENAKPTFRVLELSTLCILKSSKYSSGLLQLSQSGIWIL